MIEPSADWIVFVKELLLLLSPLHHSGFAIDVVLLLVAAAAIATASSISFLLELSYHSTSSAFPSLSSEFFSNQ